jgi:hypothetical protein
MIKSMHQILPPAATFRGRRINSGANSRAVTVTRGRPRPGVRDALFVHIGAENAPTDGSAGFIAQHLDQEWVHWKPYIDPRRGVSAYRWARNLRVQRLDLLPLI